MIDSTVELLRTLAANSRHFLHGLTEDQKDIQRKVAAKYERDAALLEKAQNAEKE